MKLILEKIDGTQAVVTENVTQFNLGVNFTDAQHLERKIVETYEQLTGNKFPTKPLYPDKNSQGSTPQCMKPPEPPPPPPNETTTKGKPIEGVIKCIPGTVIPEEPQCECEGCGMPCESDENSNREGSDRDNSELCLCNECKKAMVEADKFQPDVPLYNPVLDESPEETLRRINE